MTQGIPLAEQAVALCQAAEELAPSDYAQARGKWNRAFELFAEALMAKPDLFEALTNWGVALDGAARATQDIDRGRALGMWEEAHEKFEQALRLAEDQAQTHHNAAIALVAEARFIAEFDPERAEASWEAAYEHFARSINLEPAASVANLVPWSQSLSEHAAAIVHLRPAEAQRRFQMAEERLGEAEKISGGLGSEGLILRGTLFTERAMWAEAAETRAQLREKAYEYLAAARQVVPRDAHVHFLLATLAHSAAEESLGDPAALERCLQRAEEAYSAALNLEEQHAPALVEWAKLLGLAAEGLRERQPLRARQLLTVAEEKLRRAAKLLPGQPVVWSSLGHALSDRAALVFEKEPAAAKPLWLDGWAAFRKAVELAPTDAEHYFGWATALSAHGVQVSERWAGAARAALKHADELFGMCLRLLPDDAHLRSHAAANLLVLAADDAEAQPEVVRERFSRATALLARNIPASVSDAPEGRSEGDGQALVQLGLAYMERAVYEASIGGEAAREFHGLALGALGRAKTQAPNDPTVLEAYCATSTDWAAALADAPEPDHEAVEVAFDAGYQAFAMVLERCRHPGVMQAYARHVRSEVSWIFELAGGEAAQEDLRERLGQQPASDEELRSADWALVLLLADENQRALSVLLSLQRQGELPFSSEELAQDELFVDVRKLEGFETLLAGQSPPRPAGIGG